MMGFHKGYELDKYVGKVIDTSKPNQRRVKRVVNDNKVGLSILGGAVATIAVGVGVIGTALFNKKKANTYKKKIKEMETENQRLRANLISMNKTYMSYLGIEEEDLVDYNETEFEPLGEDYASEYADFNDEKFEEEVERFHTFQGEVAQSLERDGDDVTPQYEPNQTIVFSEDELEELAEGLNEVEG